MASFRERFSSAWNAFRSNKNQNVNHDGWADPYPARHPMRYTTSRSIVATIYNRIATDVAAVDIKHVKVDENGQYISTIESPLNYCLNQEANIDQTGRELIFDLVMTMFDHGCAVVVPIDTSNNPNETGQYDVHSMRVGTPVAWHPRHITVDLYNDRTGKHEQVTVSKDICAVCTNPLYGVMNEPNSMLQRLKHKLALLDTVDDANASDKFNMIIQLPYETRSELRMQQADMRLNKVEQQLSKSKYGIAYIDGTEKVIQLNRVIETNLGSQVEWLTNEVYKQLGMPPAVLDGTADEATMLNYYNSTVEPILACIVDNFNRKFLTKTARSSKYSQRIIFIKDPFTLVPVSQIAEIADKFTRNEILSPNEVRSIIGIRPSDDPAANELRNRNIAAPGEPGSPGRPGESPMGVEAEGAGDPLVDPTVPLPSTIDEYDFRDVPFQGVGP